MINVAARPTTFERARSRTRSNTHLVRLTGIALDLMPASRLAREAS